MNLIPNSDSIIQGESTVLYLVDYDPEATITAVSSAPAVASCSYSDGQVTVLGLTSGSAVITVTDGTNSATATITVASSVSFVDITADGSGTGNDTSVFGRQYIINNNLKAVNEVTGLIRNQVKLIKILSITNQATNAANLALIITNLALCLDKLNDLASSSAGKNTVEIG